MTVTFQQSLAAALVSGAVALMTPMLLHAQTTTTNGSASGSGAVHAQPANGANAAAGANAAGAASENSGQNMSAPNSTATGTYGGMGSDQTKTLNNDVNKAKKKATSPMSSPDNNITTQPH